MCLVKVLETSDSTESDLMWISGENLELQVNSPNLKKPKNASVIAAQIMIQSECVV